MTTVLISGATGYAGRFIAEAFLGAGHRVIVMGRSRPPAGFFSKPVTWVPGDLNSDRDYASAFDGVDVFVHCAFAHVPGRYRGGEGDDPDGFKRANLDGTLALMRAARARGVARAVFLSSRAVYGPKAAGMALTEETECAPDTLYGDVKLATEQALTGMAAPGFLPIILRATGIYGPAGPGQRHKWADLFDAFGRGEPIAPRVGTEVHGHDLAEAVGMLASLPPGDLTQYGPTPVFNVSDIVLDRRDLLGAYAKAMSSDGALPVRADASSINAMDCSRLRALGWAPRGHLDLSGVL